VFRSTLRQSQPIKPVSNVCPQNVSLISMKFGMLVEVDEWCMMVCSMTRSMVKITSPSVGKSGHFRKMSPPPLTIGAGNWPRILKPSHNIQIWLGRIFDIFLSFCVTWRWTWQKRELTIVDRQSRTGLIFSSG